ncbi:MAG: hypothetical protein COA96_15030 [SAR86 cluster bacterium]|uniref:Uncharacterized protein n=1 Tax=SAR86 cluster bacterium TaxID=2030880 RepID=A0A2A5ARY8_9GAMM|nr:MAG: hypothetical protein COA96_15030 [SAR86 cluster bacterium]
MKNEIELLALRQVVRAITNKKELSFGAFVYFGHERAKKDEKHHVDTAWFVLREMVANDEVQLSIQRKPKLDKELKLTKGSQYRKLKKRYEEAMQDIISGASGYRNKKRYDFQKEEIINMMRKMHENGEHISPFQVLYASGREKWLGGLSALLAMEYDFGRKHFPLQIMQGFVTVSPSQKFLRTHGLSSRSRVSKVTSGDKIQLSIIKPTTTHTNSYFISYGNDFKNKIEVFTRTNMWQLLYDVALGKNWIPLETEPPHDKKTLENLNKSARLKKLFGESFVKVLRMRGRGIEPSEAIDLECISESTMNRRIGKQADSSA